MRFNDGFSVSFVLRIIIRRVVAFVTVVLQTVSVDITFDGYTNMPVPEKKV
jgi:hypothetical protein